MLRSQHSVTVRVPVVSTGDADVVVMHREPTTRVHSPQQNLLLASLSVDVQQRLFPHLELVYLPFGRMLPESGTSVRHVHFPTDSLIALLCMLQTGDADEISVAGNDGVVGVASFMGGESSPQRAVVQVPGFAYRLAKSRVNDEFDHHGELLRVLLHYVGALITQVSLTAACNRHHTVEQQLCRWLLLCLDRVHDSPLAMTHGAMAELLGVRRESISSAAAGLRQRGLIEYHRGHVTVLDRGKLETLVCECYQVIRAAATRLPHAESSPIPWLPAALSAGLHPTEALDPDREAILRRILQDA